MYFNYSLKKAARKNLGKHLVQFRSAFFDTFPVVAINNKDQAL